MKLNKKTNCLWLFALLAVLSLPILVLSQNRNTNTNTSLPARTTTPTPTPTATPTPKPKVTGVTRLGLEQSNTATEAGIGDVIIVKVSNLKALDNSARCRNADDTEKPDCIPQDIALFLDKRKIDGIKPESVVIDGENGSIRFHLERNVNKNDKNDEAWADLLGAPSSPLGEEFYKRDTEISVGLANGSPIEIDTRSNKFQLRRILEHTFWLSTLGLLVLLVLLIWLAWGSDMLRSTGELPGGKRKAFSLARCQMAFWFFLVIASFLYIWMITGAYDVITTSALALIGISSGTALGAALIDASKQGGVESDLRNLKAEEKTLHGELTPLKNKLSSVPPPVNLTDLQKVEVEKSERLNEVQSKIDDLKKTLQPPATKSLLTDILSDATGITFHRFQMFVWTIILGIIFIYSVWKRFLMPDFDVTLLSLLGISAGTYLGFKFPERKA